MPGLCPQTVKHYREVRPPVALRRARQGRAYENPNVPYVLPDGSHARDIHGKELKLTLPDSDSGVYLRDMQGKSQVNIWCRPPGSWR